MKDFKTLLFALLFIGANSLSFAQLSAGDIAFIGVNEDAGPTIGKDHSFTWIALTDIPAGEVIYFTEQGVNTNINSWYANTEGHYSWTAPAGGLPCGSIVHIYETATPEVLAIDGAGTISGVLSGAGWNLSSGDQVLAYQSTAGAQPAFANLTFIAGIHLNDDLFDGETNGWTSTGYNGTGVAQCHLPPGLTNGVNCISLYDGGAPENDNNKYTGSLTGPAATVRGLINSPAASGNWSGDNFIPSDITPGSYTSSITCAAPCTDPTVPTITSTPATICTGNSATLNISGTLNDATQWAVYTGSCGGTLVGTTTTSSFTAPAITSNTTYFVRGEGGCVTPGSCGTITATVDPTPPTAVCQNISVFLDGAGNASITAADIDGGSTDNCGAINLSASQTAFTCADVGPNNVTLTVTDGNGNSSNCVAVVTIQDTVSPTAVCQNITVFLDGAGNASITAADLDGGSSDNCGTPVLTTSQSSFTCADIGPNNVTLTATDGSGNTSSCISTVTVVDTVSPTAVCQNISAFLDGAGNTTITAADLDGGSSDNCGSITLSASQTAFTCADSGPNNVTLTATDGSGNTSNCVAVVTIQDTVSPTAVCQNVSVFLNGAGNTTIVAADLDGGSTDNCGAVTFSASQTAFTCADIGANNVTLTITDASGNTANCSAVVTVLDTISPVTTCPGNQMETPDAACNFTLPDYTGLATASDNCTGSPAITQSPAPGTVISGTTTITMTANDGSGNTSSCTFNVILADATSPTAVCQNINVYLDGAGNATIVAPDIDGGSTDNCSGLTLSASQTVFTCANIGSNNVTLTATDGNANSSNCIAVVTVLDTVSPVADAASLVDLTEECEITSLTAPTATDNCVGTITGTHNATLPITSTTTITWTYDDGNGNTSTQTQEVIIDDVSAPVADVATLADLTEECEVTSLTAPTATDNCSATITGTHGATLPITSTTTITWTYDDGNGNTSTQTQEVVISDNIAPIADNASLTTVTAQCEVTSLTAPTATDNCVGTVTGTHGATLPITSSTTITWTYDDGNGNTSTQTQDIVINDVTGTDTQTACGSYTWIDGNTYTSDNNTATFNIVGGAASGCDSLVTLDLTITSGTNTNVDVVVNSTNDVVLIAENSNAQYQWLDCDDNYSVIAGANNQAYLLTQNGNYAVEITDGLCTDTSACNSINNLSVDQYGLEKFKIYPNPTSGIVNIRSTDVFDKIEVLNAVGQIVHSVELDQSNEYQIQLPDEKGVYVIIVSDVDSYDTFRIVKN